MYPEEADMKLPAVSLSAWLLLVGGLAAGDLRDSSVTTSTGQNQVRSENPKNRANARATDYIGQEVVNSSEQPLGEIVDLAVHGSQGRVIYAVLASGGLFGLGQDLFAVSIGALVRDGVGDVLMLDISPALLDEKDAFDADDWPPRANQSLVEATTVGTRHRPRQSAP
jgi:PRC-barrel domain